MLLGVLDQLVSPIPSQYQRSFSLLLPTTHLQSKSQSLFLVSQSISEDIQR